MVKYKRTFVDNLEELERCDNDGHPPIIEPGQPSFIIVHHDESTFYSNADQNHHWNEG